MEALISLIGDYLGSIVIYIIADISIWEDRATVFRDLAIGISTIYAITIGAKKLKVYLDEDLKQRIKDMRASNKATHEYVVKAIEEIEEENLQHKDTRPITKDDIDGYREIAIELGKRAINANTTTHTLVFLLKRVLIDLQCSYENKEYAEIIVLNDINRFFHSVLIQIMLDTRGVFEIPKISRTKRASLKSQFEYIQGIDLLPSSEPVLKFYDFTNRSRVEYLTQSLLENLGSNYPAFLLLKKYNVYLPPILSPRHQDADRIFPRPALQLIRARLEPKKFLFFTYYRAVTATYSPINDNVLYLQNREAFENHKNEFYDYIFDQELATDFFDEVTVKAKQVVNVKLKPKHSKFLFGYKKFALMKWIAKRVHTDQV